MRRTLVLAALAVGCSRASHTAGPDSLVQTVEHDGLRLEIKNHRTEHLRTWGLIPQGRAFDWVSSSSWCSVDWSATAVFDGARTESGHGTHVGAGDCDVKSHELETCSGSGRIAYRNDRFFDVVLRFEQRTFVGSVFLGESGGACGDALARTWDAATLLAHSRATGALDALLRSDAGSATVQAFLDYTSFNIGSDYGPNAMPDFVKAPEEPKDPVHVRFLRALHRGAARTPDLEAALYALLAEPAPKAPFPLQWSYDHAHRALAFAPSKERRRAYLERAIGQCSALIDDALRSNALAEALAQVGDAALTAKAKAACKGLTIPAEPAWRWVPG